MVFSNGKRIYFRSISFCLCICLFLSLFGFFIYLSLRSDIEIRLVAFAHLSAVTVCSTQTICQCTSTLSELFQLSIFLSFILRSFSAFELSSILSLSQCKLYLSSRFPPPSVPFLHFSHRFRSILLVSAASEKKRLRESVIFASLFSVSPAKAAIKPYQLDVRSSVFIEFSFIEQSVAIVLRINYTFRLAIT